MLILEKSNGGYKVISNNAFIGYFEASDDGLYYWWPENLNGYLPSYLLRELADKLDELNRDWEKEINVYFESISKCCENHLSDKNCPKDSTNAVSK